MRNLLYVCLALIIVLSLTDAQAGCPRTLKIKGFYIGMSLAEALKAIEAIGLKLNSNNSDYLRRLSISGSFTARLGKQELDMTMENHKIRWFKFNEELTDRLFNATSWCDTFIYEFGRAYGLNFNCTKQGQMGPGLQPCYNCRWKAFNCSNSVQGGYKIFFHQKTAVKNWNPYWRYQIEVVEVEPAKPEKKHPYKFD